MSDGFTALDAHAYVDNSLTPGERIAFQAALRRDAKLRARVETWEAQSDAIRLAFGGAPRVARHAPSVGRPTNENNVAKPSLARPNLARPAAGKQIRARKSGRLWRALAGGVVFVAAWLALSGGPDDPRSSVLRRAEAGLRTSSAFADTKLDFISDDPRAVSAWLGGRFAHVDPRRLKAPGWSLLGVRIVPGGDAAAALVLFEDAVGARAALLLEPTDAAPLRPVLSARKGDRAGFAGVEPGFAYAAVGPSRSGVDALIPSASAP